jgi:hypothetical protein
MVMLYALQPLDIENIIRELNQAAGNSIAERLKATISSRLIDTGKITFSEDTIAFHAPVDAAKTAFALIIKSNHE